MIIYDRARINAKIHLRGIFHVTPDTINAQCAIILYCEKRENLEVTRSYDLLNTKE